MYPAAFHRVVLIGELYGDSFNTTLSMVPTGGTAIPAVTQTLCDNVAAAVAAFWPKMTAATPGSGLELLAAARLSSVKVNRIGPDGRYVDALARETVLTPLAGPGSVRMPPQLACAATLRGPNPRAKAGRGRMYFPPSSWFASSLGTDGRISSTAATNHANGVVGLLQDLNDVYLSAGVVAVAGIASKAGTGAFQPVVQVTVGRVLDTIRSRRNKLDEDFVTVAI